MKSFRRKPSKLLLYEVLQRRAMVDENTRQEIMLKYNAMQSGYLGERRVDNEWREVNVQGLLWHDFTCRNTIGNTHQIDTLFICKHFLLVVEIKNVSGRIDFDDARRQFLRTREDGKVESFMNPIDQVKRHRDLLVEATLDWPMYVPVEAVVVIANPSTVIGRISSEIPVFNVSGLRTKVQELVKKHASVSFNPRIVRSYLEKMYEPLDFNKTPIRYNYRKGVLCHSCNEVMIHNIKGFLCPRCGGRDKEHIALRQAMFDYRILFSEWITNKEFRDFVGITSPKTANTLLKKLLAERQGINKGRRYIIPQDIGGSK